MEQEEQFDLDKELSRQMRALSRRARTEHEIRQRLADRGLAEEDIDAIIASLLRYSFLDDQRYAREFVRSKFAAGYGEHRIRMQLRERGCPEQFIDPAIREAEEEESQAEVLNRVLKQRLRSKGEPDDPRSLKNLLDFCTRRGFDYELIKRRLEPWFHSILGD
jgi:regulatory protein